MKFFFRIVSGFQEDKPAEMCKERSARLHELMRDQTMVEGGSQVRVTSSLLDRAFRQFVFESMPLSHVDGGGKVVCSGANQPSISLCGFCISYETIYETACVETY